MLKNKILILSLEICGFLCALKGIFYQQVEMKKEEKIEKFFQEKKEYGILEENNFTMHLEKEDYIGIIEIPSIQLKVGFFSKESQFNSVEYGIELIKRSKMPDEGGNLLLASHSGTSNISYFKNIHLLKENDLIYVYYKNRQYTYHVQFLYEEEKDGSISLPKVRDKTLLTLTTCKGDKQLIIISELVYFTSY